MATHMTSFPRSSLLKGGKVAVRPRSTLALWRLQDVHQRLVEAVELQGVSGSPEGL
jgi:hypothetical protein